MTPQPTKQHILEATINAIEKHGVQNLTTRTIAQEAGVNNAALHYYYGTKENLIAEALSLTLDHMMEDTHAILAGAGSIAERILALFTFICEGVLRFPNLIRAHLNGPLMQGERDSPFLDAFGAWQQRISAELEPFISSPEGEAALPIAIHAAFSSVLIAGLLPNTPGVSPGDLNDPQARQAYIACLVENVLPRHARSGQQKG
jgi:AcrR family transcriptional regulator